MKDLNKMIESIQYLILLSRLLTIYKIFIKERKRDTKTYVIIKLYNKNIYNHCRKLSIEIFRTLGGNVFGLRTILHLYSRL